MPPAMARTSRRENLPPNANPLFQAIAAAFSKTGNQSRKTPDQVDAAIRQLKLLNDEIKVRSARNLVMSRFFRTSSRKR
mgnify:CR=1 FL=1